MASKHETIFIPDKGLAIRYKNTFAHYECKTYYWHTINEEYALTTIPNGKPGVRLNKYYRDWDDDFMVVEIAKLGINKWMSYVKSLYYKCDFYNRPWESIEELVRQKKSPNADIIAIDVQILALVKQWWPIYVNKKIRNMRHALGKTNKNYTAPNWTGVDILQT